MTNPNPLDISVVILSYNSARYLDKCIKSIIEAMPTSKYSFDIHIIDNGSKDGSTGKLLEFQKRYPDHIKLKFFSENTGTTRSRNHALNQINSRQVLVLDSDAYINAQAIDRLYNTLENNPDIGMIVPKVLYPSGKFQKSTDVFPTLANKFMRYFFLKAEEKKGDQRPLTESVDVDYAISAFWLFRGPLTKEIGVLDENIFYSPEDVDYCIRIRKKGYRIVYDPSVHIVHDAQEISRKKLNKFFFSHLKGLLYLFKKHRYGIIKKSPV